jgi:hypothetical protein
MSINKPEFSWLVVRVVGIFFLVEAVLALLDLAALYYAYVRTQGMEAYIDDYNWQITNLISHMITGAISLFVYSLLTYYFLRAGKFFYNLLMYAGAENET